MTFLEGFISGLIVGVVVALVIPALGDESCTRPGSDGCRRDNTVVIGY